MKADSIQWLDETHPNYLRWKRAREISIARGKFVESIVSQEFECRGLTILDLGSGEGGTTNVFSKNNFVISFDLSKIRLQRQSNSDVNSQKICGNISDIPLKKKSFDLIILQDVIEHLQLTNRLVDELYGLLQERGIIYLSTPNKFSVFNILADPHWGVPFISLLKRESVKKYFLNYFRKSEVNREDIPELLSLRVILDLFDKNFNLSLFTVHSVKELFNGNKGIAWSDFHLKLIKVARILGLDKIIVKIANDKIGFVNQFLTPTFYMVLKRKPGISI